MMTSIKQISTVRIGVMQPPKPDDAYAAVDCERRYLTRRADEELRATVNATVIEAEIVHNELIRTYLVRCRDCEAVRTATCKSCKFEYVCDVATDYPGMADADKAKPNPSEWVAAGGARHSALR